MLRSPEHAQSPTGVGVTSAAGRRSNSALLRLCTMSRSTTSDQPSGDFSYSRKICRNDAKRVYSDVMSILTLSGTKFAYFSCPCVIDARISWPT